MTEPLARFGHHPDPAIDFCVEVEEIVSIHVDEKIGIRTDDGLDQRIFKAMQFRVGGDLGAVDAKGLLRNIERERA